MVGEARVSSADIEKLRKVVHHCRWGCEFTLLGICLDNTKSSKSSSFQQLLVRMPV